MPRILADFLPFRAAVVPAIKEHFSTLASATTGGVLRKAIQIASGTGACITTTAMYTGVATTRNMVCQFDA